MLHCLVTQYTGKSLMQCSFVSLYGPSHRMLVLFNALVQHSCVSFNGPIHEILVLCKYRVVVIAKLYRATYGSTRS